MLARKHFVPDGLQPLATRSRPLEERALSMVEFAQPHRNTSGGALTSPVAGNHHISCAESNEFSVPRWILMSRDSVSRRHGQIKKSDAELPVEDMSIWVAQAGANPSEHLLHSPLFTCPMVARGVRHTRLCRNGRIQNVAAFDSPGGRRSLAARVKCRLGEPMQP